MAKLASLAATYREHARSCRTIADLHEATGNRVGADWLRSRAAAWDSMADWLDDVVADEDIEKRGVLFRLHADGAAEAARDVYKVGATHLQLIATAGVNNVDVVAPEESALFLAGLRDGKASRSEGGIDALLDHCRAMSDDDRITTRWGVSERSVAHILTVLNHPFELATGYEGVTSTMHAIRLLAEGATLLVAFDSTGNQPHAA